MFQRLHHRGGHYLLLLVVAAGLFLPNLGVPSLWDIDEGNNAEAAREMLESGNWVVPTFNYQLRIDKPALLYWLQIACYRGFGVGEFAARLPSALAALAAVLLTYDLGRRLFGATAGLIAGLVLASAGLFCAAAHFANPDALLNAFTVLTFLIFWRSFAHGDRTWFVPAGASIGLAVLAKGPVGLVLPAAVIGLFLLCSRQFRLLFDRRLLLGALTFALVALPWYAWVGAETKGAFLRGFLRTHNWDRYLSPMENHGGPFYYYFVVLSLGFAPWSAFLGLAACSSFREWKHGSAPERTAADSALRALRCAPHAHVFLWCWIAVYFVFFTFSSTKLPNYILPLYAPVALLTARFLDRWRRGALQSPVWALHLSLGLLALMGVGTMVAFVLAGGVVEASFLRGRRFPGLESGALLGIVPLAGALAAWWCSRRNYRDAFVASLAVAAVLFIGPLIGWGSIALDAQKAPRPLIQAGIDAPTKGEIRVGYYQYFQPSLVFYTQREVQCLSNDEQMLEFLRCPLVVYLFLPGSEWDRLKEKVPGTHRLLGRHYDLYRGYDVVLVTNR
jgi:4-amino-4-deoxy-L-arabinose transferase-like glycosyltransferase